MTWSRAYTDADDAMLAEMVAADKPWSEIAARLCRPEGSVMKRAQRLKLRRPSSLPRREYMPHGLAPDVPPVVGMRKCLGTCGKMFPSRGIHNRLCPPCSAVINGVSGTGFEEMAIVGVRRRA